MKIKPTGLKGTDKIQRIQSLMGKLNPINESYENSALEHMKYGPDGVAYGIVRENHNYFIKTSDKTDGNLEAKDFEYIGGLQNKMTEAYRSYEDALRHLNMKFKDLNESYNIRENIDLFRSDFLMEGSKKKMMNNEQEEDTTFKLKVDAPEDTTSEVPEVSDVPAEETPEVPAEPTTEPIDMPADTTEPSTEETPEETEVSDEDSDDLEKDIQRLTGKIGQKMRELDEPNPELEKYVINSIMSALDVESMDEDFKEDLISKLEGEEEEPSEEPTEEEPIEEPTEEPVESEPSEEPTEEESEVKSESRVISKKSLLENLKSKKLLKNKLKKTIKESDEFYGKFKKFDLDDEDMLDEMEKMDVFSNPAELTNSFSSLKKGSYGVKDPKTGQIKSFVVNEDEDEDENIYEIELDEDWMEEGNKFTDMLRKTKKGGTFKIGNKTYKDTSSYDDLDEEFEEEFEMSDEKKPLHNKPFDLSSVKSTKEEDLDENYDEFEMDLQDDLNTYGDDFSDELDIKFNKPTIAPPPVKTPPKTPRRDKPFKPQIKPQIQPKGYRD